MFVYFFSCTDNDLDDVWSIRKNVAIKQTTQKPSATEGWNLNVKKGYYSRHGGLTGELLRIVWFLFDFDSFSIHLDTTNKFYRCT